MARACDSVAAVGGWGEAKPGGFVGWSVSTGVGWWRFCQGSLRSPGFSLRGRQLRAQEEPDGHGSSVEMTWWAVREVLSTAATTSHIETTRLRYPQPPATATPRQARHRYWSRPPPG
jgi:hypothetical protein